jgi:hypothetical protein
VSLVPSRPYEIRIKLLNALHGHKLIKFQYFIPLSFVFFLLLFVLTFLDGPEHIITLLIGVLLLLRSPGE